MTSQPADPRPQDPRAERDGICRVTAVGGTGIEWICIRKVHAKWENRNRGTRDGRGNVAQAERHYMVPRYPTRGAP